MSSVGMAIVGTGSVVTFAKVSAGEMPDARTFIGLAGLWMFLALVADASEELATPLAWLIFLTVLFSYGSEWISNINKAFKTTKKGKK